MRRACLFLWLVIGWSILLMKQDRNGWIDRWSSRWTVIQALAAAMETEEECIASGGVWDPVTCTCSYPDPGCDPADEAACELDPLCTWDDLLCECDCEVCETHEEWTGSLTIGPYEVCEGGDKKECETLIDYFDIIDCFGVVVGTREEQVEDCISLGESCS